MLIIFPLNLQTITVTRMLPSGGGGGSIVSVIRDKLHVKSGRAEIPDFSSNNVDLI